MNKPLVVIAAILGIALIVLACVYWLVPAGSLPTFMPGFVEGETRRLTLVGALTRACGPPVAFGFRI
jgi:hypothetical protein